MEQSADLSHAAVLLTGAANGIGRAFAIALSRTGCRLVLSDRDKDAIAETVALCGGLSDRLAALPCDLSIEAERQELVASARQRAGTINVLINNAGVGSAPGKFWDAPVAEVQACMDVNAVAPLRLSMLLAPEMAADGWGRIVNITTSIGTMLMITPYGGSKAANEATVVKMADDLRGSGVTANVLVPGGVTASAMGDRSGIAKENMLAPEIMVPPLFYLLSRASDAVTGQRLVATRWDTSLPPDAAAAAAASAAAWPVTQAIVQTVMDPA